MARSLISRMPLSIQVLVNALGTWWDDWVNQTVLNLVWAICQVTIVLGPPATFGMAYVANRLVHGEATGLSGWWQGLRRYLLVSWLWGLANLVVAVVLYANLVMYGSIDAFWGPLLQGVALAVSAFWAVVQLYAVPFLMEQTEPKLLRAWRNGLFTLLAAPGYSLVLIVAVILILALSAVTLAPLFLGGPCLILVIGNQAVVERLEHFGVRQREAVVAETPEP